MIQYNKQLKEKARELRNNSTKGEVILWKKLLRAKKMYGYQFNRQMPLKISENKSIIVDFICRKLRLIIEVDGYSHQFKYNKDKMRDELLAKEGYTVLRIKEVDVRKRINYVADIIENRIKDLANFHRHSEESESELDE